MPRPSILLAALLLVTTGLTGCIGMGDDTDTTTTPTNATNPQQPDQNQTQPLEPLRFEDATPVSTTVTENGTFSPQDACTVTTPPEGACATGGERTIDLTDQIPTGVPVQLALTLTFENPTGIFLSPVWLSLDTGDALVYGYENTTQPTQATINTTLLSTGSTITAEFSYRYPTGAEPDISYTFTANINADPTRLPPGAPVAVDLEPGDELILDTAGGASGGAVGLDVRSPTDERTAYATAGRGPLSVAIPAQADAGEYVLIVPGNRQAATIQTNATDPTMRPLDLTLTLGEMHPAAPGQSVEWSFELDQAPVSVGLYLEETQQFGASSDQGTATLEGPSGTLLEGEFGCGTCLTGGYYQLDRTPNGAPGLAPGSYTATYEAPPEAGYGVGHVIVGYQR